jgi:hypothetical protein
MNLHSYGEVFNLGHRMVLNIFDDEVLIEEKIDGCVSPDARILTQNLEWIPAGDIKLGQEIIGVEQMPNKRFRLCKSVITCNKPIKKLSVRVITDCGEIIVTEDHPFLMRAHKKIKGNGRI